MYNKCQLSYTDIRNIIKSILDIQQLYIYLHITTKNMCLLYVFVLSLTSEHTLPDDSESSSSVSLQRLSCATVCLSS